MRKKRILFIINYGAPNNVLSGRQPNHHLFGFHQIVHRGYDVDFHVHRNGDNILRLYLKTFR